MNPYYQDESVTLYCGDCRDVLSTIAADVVITDPPYGHGYTHGGGGRGRHHRRLPSRIVGTDTPFDPAPLLRFPVIVTWGANHYAQQLPCTGRWLVWDKLAGHTPWDSFSDIEIAWCNRPGADRIFPYLWKGICQGGEKGRKHHPYQKPLALMQWCITQAGDAGTILDPYAGAGSTLVAAKQLGRRAIGIEIEARYCAIAAERLAATERGG